MKVAFCIRPTWNTPLGGDGVQMLSTKKYLEEDYGVEVDVVTDPEQINLDYDIVHIFNFATVEETEKFFEKATSLNIPIASSTIYWDYSYACTYVVKRILGYPKYLSEKQINRERFLLKLFYFFKKPKYTSFWFKRKLRNFILYSDALLPNSEEEGELLLKFCGLYSREYKEKIHVVFNGVDVKHVEKDITKDDFLTKYNIPDHYILQVGRIEYVKNQLNLIYSLKDNKEIPIVFVGRPVEQGYFAKVKNLANKRGNVFFINNVPHDEIMMFYKYAEIHVLPSLRESPGLVSLEAAKEGCPIVVSSSNFAPVKTYFPLCPYVINPIDIEDMREIILKAYRERKRTDVDFHSYTWAMAAKQTFDAYQSIKR